MAFKYQGYQNNQIFIAEDLSNKIEYNWDTIKLFVYDFV